MTDLAHPLWIEPWPLVLASASASRAALLRAAGIPIDITPADIEERVIESQLVATGASAKDTAVALAIAKAKAVSATRPQRFVLGADQTLVVGSEHLHKPAGTAEARKQLLKLREREHWLHSGAALVRDGEVIATCLSSARMVMRAFSEEFLDRYLAQAGEAVTRSIGSYQLEGPGIHLFESIEGDHFTILGLPLVPLLDIMRGQGMVIG